MAKRAPLESLDAAYDAAVKLLARKSRTTAEVRQQLLDQGAAPDDVESVIGRLQANRHLDDAVLASDEAFKLLEGKGLAPTLAVHMLTERGLSDSLARASVEDAREGLSELELCARALSRRLHGKPLGREAVEKEGRALARLGYEEDVVLRTLERAVQGSGE